MIIKDDEFVDIHTPSGPMRTFIFRPVAPGRYPGLVVYSEIYQVTAPIRRLAAQFAGHGFVVAAPEIYHEFLPAGVAFHYDEPGTARGNELKIAKTIASYDDDASAALGYLKSHPNCTGKLGVAGFCIGGHLAFRAAMNPEVSASACWYPTDIHEGSLGKGKSDNSMARIPDIKVEML